MEKLDVMVSELITVYQRKSGEGIVDAKDLHKGLEVETPFHKWIDRRIKNNKFKDGVDFWTILSESTGGRPSTDYHLTIDAAKHIAMLEKNDIGFAVRTYFIEVEKLHRDWLQQRANGKATRLDLTDNIQKKFGDNKFNFINYTNLMYNALFGMTASEIKKQLGLPLKGKKKGIRDNVSTETNKQIENAENEISVLIGLNFPYNEIRERINDKYKSRLLIS